MKLNHFTIILATCVILTALTSSKPKKVKLDELYKKVFVGTNGNFAYVYACTHEVTNIDFKEYLYSLKETNQMEKYNAHFPDTSQWRKKFPYSFYENWQKKYFSHIKFNNHPVINITKEAAEGYCKWLTGKINSNEKRQYKKVSFRLPTEHEWNRLAAPLPGHTLPWYGNFAYGPSKKNLISSPDGYYANVKFLDKTSKEKRHIYANDGGMVAITVESYKPNQIGIYDIIGNVAEMTSSGVIKGGSWDNTVEECHIGKSQNYTLPDPRVGFRVVMVIEEF